MTITLAQFATDHIVPAQALSAAVGWTHTLRDWVFLSEHGTGVVSLDGSDLVGVALRWEQGHFDSIGMVIVSPAVQGKGTGTALMHRLMSESDAHSFLLTATPMGQPLYDRLGFQPFARVLMCLGYVTNIPEPQTEMNVTRLSQADWPEAIKLDRLATGRRRTRLLTGLFQTGTVWSAGDTGQLQGYALSRQSGDGTVIGPIVAENLDIAQALVAHIMRQDPDALYRVDTFFGLGLAEWLKPIGLKEVANNAAMIHSTFPKRSAAGGPYCFGLASQALL